MQTGFLFVKGVSTSLKLNLLGVYETTLQASINCVLNAFRPLRPSKEVVFKVWQSFLKKPCMLKLLNKNLKHNLLLILRVYGTSLPLR
mmetsp:Transcript_12322/g.17045  ORF Transcript_12322/g.17045 Transcript_12322/m.17045 type:complete len:88 (+) Transcript_12322:134-397(+)